MPKLEFVDLKTKKKFSTDKFTVKELASGRKMAIATAPSGRKSSRFLSKTYK